MFGIDTGIWQMRHSNEVSVLGSPSGNLSHVYFGVLSVLSDVINLNAFCLLFQGYSFVDVVIIVPFVLVMSRLCGYCYIELVCV